MKIGFAQINPTVGDLSGNCEKIADAYERLAAAARNWFSRRNWPSPVTRRRISFSNRVSFRKIWRCWQSCTLASAMRRCWSVSSIAMKDAANRFVTPRLCSNAASRFAKPTNPFCRLTMSSTKTAISSRRARRALSVHGKKIGVTICEDIWTEHYLPRPLYDGEPVRSLVEQGAEIIVNLSASPFSLGKPAIRREMVAALARAHQRPIIYCNVVGGNDQLVFDGNSIAVNSAGELIAQLPAFREAEAIVETDSQFGNRISRGQNTGANFCRAFSRAARLPAASAISSRRCSA